MNELQLIDQISSTSIANVKGFIAQLITVQKEILIANEDYYVIKEGSKPSLSKSGAEKICALFDLSPSFEDQIIRSGDTFEVISKCKLHRRKDNILMGEGSGMATSDDPKYDKNRGRNDFIYNAVLKMAQKKALVAATLFSTHVSFIFTQDIEDLEPIMKTAPTQQYKSNGNGNGNKPDKQVCPLCGEKSLIPNQYGSGFYCLSCKGKVSDLKTNGNGSGYNPEADFDRIDALEAEYNQILEQVDVNDPKFGNLFSQLGKNFAGQNLKGIEALMEILRQKVGKNGSTN